MQVHNTVQKVMIETIPKKKKCQKTKWLSEEALKIAEERREVKGKGEKERYTQLNTELQRIARRGNKAFFSENAKRERKMIEQEKIDLRKFKIPKEHFLQKWAQ